MAYHNAISLILTGLMFLASAGVAHAETNDREVVRSSDGQIVHIDNGTCVRTKWETDTDWCASRRVAQRTTEKRQIRHAAEFMQEERTVYFEFDKFALSSEAKARLDTLIDALKHDETVKEATIVGYADRIGSVVYNDRLSQKRAETVRDYVIAKGYTNARVTETRWVGKSKPSTSCPKNETRKKLIACLQPDRRVKVEIVLVNDEQNPHTR
jgi:OmpA-OmpF porin, OOP family